MEFNKQFFAHKSLYRNYSLRRGQSIFIEVHKIFPEEANALTGTVYDCFYLDEKIDLFLEKMRQLVERKEDVVIYDKPITTYEETRPESTYLKNFSYSRCGDEQEIDAEEELFKAFDKACLADDKEYWMNFSRETRCGNEQEIDAEKELFKAYSNDMDSHYKRLYIEREYFMSLTREKDDYKSKTFYRLGESMETRRLRGDRV